MAREEKREEMSRRVTEGMPGSRDGTLGQNVEVMRRCGEH